MLSFRHKLYLSYLVVFLVFLALLFPFAAKVVRGIVRKSLSDKTSQMIAIVRSAPSETSMVRRLEERAPYVFFRVSLIEPDGRFLYDSHAVGSKAWDDPEAYLREHPEVSEAIQDGVGYSEAYSYALSQRLLYIAKSFDYQGKTLVMRTAFPLLQINEMAEDFEMGFLTLGVVVLILFSLMTSIIAIHLSRPIQKIIQAIRPYQQGKVEHLPEISLGGTVSRKDDFQKLAETLNSMNRQIEKQIDTLKEERNEKAATLESLIEGVVAVDRHLIVTYANRQALEMLQLEANQLIGQHFMVTNHQEFQDLLVQCQKQGEVLTITSELGERKRIYLDVIAVSKGSGLGAVLILQDKSIHYKALEMRKDFIANASHELKTPLTIVRGFAEALHDNPDMPEETMEQVTGKILSSCERMERLVKNLLRLADIENLPRANLQQCNVFELIQSCKQMVLPVYADAEVVIRKIPSQEVTILADADLLELAITNLLDNGAKYSHPPAKITVTIDLDPDRQEVKLVIADQGIGIPPEDVENIFQRFYTVDKAHSRRLGGSGLGLSIVQTIIKKHFGKITLESVVGQGSTFTILLPVNLESFQP